MKSYTRLAFIILVLLVPLLAHAQEGGGKKKISNSLLPDINPQDIEIKGNFQATFPGLRRQPILGFNPTPPVFQINPNRVPFMESPDQAVANIPISKLESPIGPQQPRFTYPKEGNIYARLGLGSYFSPEGVAYLETPAGANSRFVAGVNYSSTDGHIKGASDSDRNLHFHVGWDGQVGSNDRLGVDLAGTSAFNYLPYLTQKTNYGGTDIKLGYEHVKNAYHEFDAHVKYDYFTYFLSKQPKDNYEHVFDIGLKQSLEGPAMNSGFVGSVGFTASQYNTQNVSGKQWYIVHPEVAYEQRFGYAQHLKIGASFYASSDSMGSKLNIYPEVEYSFFGIKRIKIKGWLTGFVENGGMRGYFENRRMIVSNMVPLNNRYWEVGGSASFQLIKNLKLTGNLRYRRYSSFQYLYSTQVPPPAGVFTSAYSYSMGWDKGANILRLEAGLVWDAVPKKFAFKFSVYAQRPKLAHLKDIPFYEHVGLHTEFSVKPIDRLYIKGWVNYLGKRAYDLKEHKLGTAWLGGARVEFELTHQLGVYVKTTNAFDARYQLLPTYQEMPVRFYGGIILKP